MTTYTGSGSADTYVGVNGDSYTIFGLNGADTLVGADGDDAIYGGNQNDILGGGAGDDTLEGGNGSDYLNGNAGYDILLGGSGGDTLVSKQFDGPDYMDGGSGNDFAFIERWHLNTDLTLDISTAMARATAQDIGDGTTVLNIERIEWRGSQGVDTVLGGDLSDKIRGNGGNDSIAGNGGNDNIQGGWGSDILWGGAGKDIIGGGGEYDEINGGAGRDQLTGDLAGKRYTDVFVYDDLSDFATLQVTGGKNYTLGTDLITDFSDETVASTRGDILDLRGVFTDAGLTGMSAAAAVADGYLVVQQDGRYVNVSFDADGSAGAGTSFILVTLGGPGNPISAANLLADLSHFNTTDAIII